MRSSTPKALNVLFEEIGDDAWSAYMGYVARFGEQEMQEFRPHYLLRSVISEFLSIENTQNSALLGRFADLINQESEEDRQSWASPGDYWSANTNWRGTKISRGQLLDEILPAFGESAGERDDLIVALLEAMARPNHKYRWRCAAILAQIAATLCRIPFALDRLLEYFLHTEYRDLSHGSDFILGSVVATGQTSDDFLLQLLNHLILLESDEDKANDDPFGPLKERIFRLLKVALTRGKYSALASHLEKVVSPASELELPLCRQLLRAEKAAEDVSTNRTAGKDSRRLARPLVPVETLLSIISEYYPGRPTERRAKVALRQLLSSARTEDDVLNFLRQKIARPIASEHAVSALHPKVISAFALLVCETDEVDQGQALEWLLTNSWGIIGRDIPLFLTMAPIGAGSLRSSHVRQLLQERILSGNEIACLLPGLLGPDTLWHPEIRSTIHEALQQRRLPYEALRASTGQILGIGEPTWKSIGTWKEAVQNQSLDMRWLTPYLEKRVKNWLSAPFVRQIQTRNLMISLSLGAMGVDTLKQFPLAIEAILFSFNLVTSDTESVSLDGTLFHAFLDRILNRGGRFLLSPEYYAALRTSWYSSTPLPAAARRWRFTTVNELWQNS